MPFAKGRKSINVKAKFKKLSICRCGFPILDEAVPIGTIYEVDVNRTEQMTVICGGCGSGIAVNAIWVDARGTQKAGFMPLEIFGNI
jgi:hypothetical protein